MTKQSPAPRTLLAATLCLAAIHVWSQQAEWASHIQGSNIDLVYSLCHDSNSNIYATGRMSNGSIDDTPIGVSGTYDIYLAKFNPAGILQWASRAGGGDPMDVNERDCGWKVLYDSISDAIYLSGTYQGTTFGNPAYFGPGIEVPGKGAFLAKYSTAGICLWMRATNNGISASITVDAGGAVYVTCWSTSELSDSTTYFGPPSTTVDGGFSIAKYTPSGQLLWAKNLGQGIGGRIASRGTHLYFAGGADGENAMLLGTSVPDTQSVGNIALVAELDTACSTVLWAHTFGSPNNAIITDLDFFTDGDLLLVGTFRDSLFLPADTLAGELGRNTPFYIRTDSAGLVLWGDNYSGNAYYYSASISQDGMFYLGFNFTGVLNIQGTIITADDPASICVVKCQPDGMPVGAFHEGPVEVGPMDILATEGNGIVVASGFSGTINFGSGSMLTGNFDVFVAKYSSITSVQSYALPGGGGQLLIYANPNQGTCSIDLPPELLHEQGLVLRILDAQGQVVQEGPLNITEGTVHLDIRAQAAGTYMAEVVNGTTRYTGRIVFE